MLKLNIVLILICAVFMGTLLLAGYSINIIKSYKSNLKTTIEQRKRADARLLLKDVIDRFDYAVNTKQVDPSSIKSVSNWAAYNFSGLRNGGATSDGFIIELGTEQYISDSSVSYKVLVNESRTMKSEIPNHTRPDLATKAFDKMRLGLNTTYGDNVTWNYNGSNEWLEWAVYPTAISIGINDEPRTLNGEKNDKYRKYIFILRTEEKEIYTPYQYIFDGTDYLIHIIYILLVVLLVFIIGTLFYVAYREYHIKWRNTNNKKLDVFDD